MILFKKITYEDILPIWENDLWPKRQSEITSTSAMCLFKTKVIDEITGKYIAKEIYDLKNMEFTPTFWGAFHNDKLVGVNSGHMCVDKMYRSRGLYVSPDYRKQGIGQKLLMKTLAQATHEKAIICWSFPKKESWKTYSKIGFQLSHHLWIHDWEESETGINARCSIILDLPQISRYYKNISNSIYF